MSRTCKKCKRPIEENSPLAEHIEVNHELKYKSCAEILDSPRKIEEHTKQEHHFKCEKCDDAYETTEAKKSHRDKEHFEYVQCGKPSNNQAYVVRHTNHDEEEIVEDVDIDSNDEVVELPAPKPNMIIELVSLVVPKKGPESFDENKSTEFPLEAPRYAGHQTDKYLKILNQRME